ncbi:MULTISPECIES: hypothetical protein [Bacillus]|uniref:hypothetical protein n=1 Tax=Bacillus TaxID=1386 RepID=UPI001159E50B|nr:MULTISPECIES: hypothetical protein [Bacillus]MCA1037028.1 hypothetical protein [Bacillus infantis]MDW2875279.1 hypothetical protein [Bacillus infantis]
MLSEADFRAGWLHCAKISALPFNSIYPKARHTAGLLLLEKLRNNACYETGFMLYDFLMKKRALLIISRRDALGGVTALVSRKLFSLEMKELH